MTEEEIQGWQKFQALALGQLDHPVDRQSFIGLGVNPSFDKMERLFVSKWPNNLKWKYKAWDFNKDYHRIFASAEEKLKLKFGKQTPVIHTIEGELDFDFYRTTEKVLETLTLKTFIKMDRFGTDGTSNTIFIGDHYRESSFSWWEDLPGEWGALKPILVDLHKNLEIARIKLTEELNHL